MVTILLLIFAAVVYVLAVNHLLATGSTWKLALSGAVLATVRTGLGVAALWVTYVVAQKLWPIFPDYNLLDLAVIMVAMVVLERLVLSPLTGWHTAEVHRRLANEATAAAMKGLAAQKLSSRVGTPARTVTLRGHLEGS